MAHHPPDTYPVTAHTDHVQEGGTFVALSGKKDCRMLHITTALNKKASLIVTEDLGSFHHQIVQQCRAYGAELVIVDDARAYLAQKAAHAAGYPSEQLTIIGITGTKGKTTTSYLIEHILQHAGYTTAVIGTISNRIKKKIFPSSLTTPESDYLQNFLQQCVDDKIDFVIMEVSSHALEHKRTAHIAFDAALFLNLAHDHLDFHITMDNYFHAKMKLLHQLKPHGTFFVLADTLWGKRALDYAASIPLQNICRIGASPENQHPIAIDIQQPTTGIALQSTHLSRELRAPHLQGRFNQENLAAALAVCIHYGIPESIIHEACANFLPPPGRFEFFQLPQGGKIVVDFAHAPIALEAVLSTLRARTDHLIVVFGCGGNRDAHKRPVMGSIAGQYADLIILTDDNPREENRLTIISDICQGLQPEHYNRLRIIPHRQSAIEYAITQCTKTSIIALCGKGHEEYYRIGTTDYRWSDRDFIRKLSEQIPE